MTRKTVANTSKTDVHQEWLGGRNPDAIEAQEARGQDELVNSHNLPTDIRGDRNALESLGVKFGEPFRSDPLFCRADLPEGWEKRPADHSMWSELVDASGIVRATIFYKAAFYDRGAFLNVEKVGEPKDD